MAGSAMPDPAGGVPVQEFWRDAALPAVEARSVADGRQVCYAPHSHEGYSLGVITAGAARCWQGGTARAGRPPGQRTVVAGEVVRFAPGEVHACNPLAGGPWSYRMFYVDARWLHARWEEAREGGVGAVGHEGAGLVALYELLVDPAAALLEKESALVTVFSGLAGSFGRSPAPPVSGKAVPLPADKLRRAAALLDARCTESLGLDELSAAAGLSPAHLVRAFKQHYGLTPHAYQINRRIQYCRAQLRAGHALAEVALAAGFADQAHMQRAFKRLMAATPGQYRRPRSRP